jgi:hypothetical protein
MVSILALSAEYESNQTGYSIGDLKARVDAIVALQNDYSEKLIQLETCRAERNRFIQSDLISTSYFGMLAKAYLKNLFHHSKPDMNRLKFIHFRIE